MNKKGFTLVELLAVIAILAILVIIALPNVLKMFNDAKKNTFLTEAKTIYNEVSKKYMSESTQGNKLTYISSEDNTKLEMTGRDLQYCIYLNSDGKIKNMQVSNGEWVVKIYGRKKISDLKISDIKDGNLNNEECGNVTTISFAEDSWATIAKAVRAGQTGNYHVGDEKEVNLGIYGKHNVRIANMSTPSECNNEIFSESACGFVLEFVDIIADQPMIISKYSNKGGWPTSTMYKFLNDESDSSSIINALPNYLKNVIIDTYTVSGHGNTNGETNFTSTDKLYLLATAEVFKNGDTNTIDYDAAREYTRQLDYYEQRRVTTNSYTGSYPDTIKMNSEGTASLWWLRSAHSNYSVFYSVYINGVWSHNSPNYTGGVSPAFRIG